MSEYKEFIVRVRNADLIAGSPFGTPYFHGEIVRCSDCKHYYEAENYHPNGNYVMRCCKYFDTYDDEVEPDGFCAWGKLRVEGGGE